ncbi:hypothetical protein [Pseudoalteromonas sp. S16_S37]|uniref:hypothetical protein n=1 Tax=Pseudoalteromonas sp. S16_S37 TaxID=2720228 RepID=UPI001680F22B|nr:hypothetical protein [Pseudoalteromonas sp. S16_S37]MBD1584821.1 hypothetical protein [Pseudoalteromonas sp. S16_S37]
METVIYSKTATPQSEPQDNHFNALRLEQLPDNVLARTRAYLYCSGCFEKAAYVSRSINGRAPHCRSVHKLVDGLPCPQKSPESVKVTTEGYDSVRALKNEEDVYKIDFNFGPEETHVNPLKPNDKETQGKKRGGYRKHGEASGVGKSEWSRRLSTLLKTLVDDPSFAHSSANIKVFGVTKPIKNVFYFTDNFERYMNYLTPNKFPAFFWGSIWDAQKGNLGDVWLNTSEDTSGLSVRIPPKVFKTLKGKLKMSEDDVLTGCSGGKFLLYGWYNRSQVSGKPLLNLLEPQAEFITLMLGDKIKNLD